jgi:patatin-like phospholipase/acyl hydrolase
MNKKILEGKPQAALEFIKKIWNACDMVCIENPISSYLNRNWNVKYQQIIQPYYFGHDYIKTTCLWLKNLPPLISTIYNEPKYKLVDSSNKQNPKSKQKIKGKFKDAKNRSKFHPFVAQAMAEQWT